MTDSYTRQLFLKLHGQICDHYIVGHDELLKQILIANLCRGHVLIEGPPGTAKTLTAKLLAHLLSKSFKRIQFTSDLLPSDILGTYVYSPEKKEFHFIKGPLFSDFIVADEINRTPPRTQSALLEAMEERQVTVEGNLMKLAPDFFVIATQNPQDFEGTFQLPEVQLDRFLIKLTVDHSDSQSETKLLTMLVDGKLPPDLSKLSPLQIDRAQIDQELSLVKIDPSLLSYIATLLEKTRRHPALLSGASFRGGVALVSTSRMLALIEGRTFVIPDDIKRMGLATLGHRVRLNPESRLSNVSERQVLEQIVQSLPFPKN